MFTRPGQLTLDFMEGRRARHVHPIQLYLLIGVVFFFLAHVNSPVSLRAEMASRAPESQERLAHMVAKRGLTLEQFLERTDERMASHFKTIDTTAFLLQGFGLWLMFRKRRPYLAEHMVMTLHLACFSMTVGLVVGALQFLGISRLLTAPVMLTPGFIYFLLAARRVYGGTWPRLTGTWVLLQLLKMGVILLAFTGVIASVIS